MSKPKENQYAVSQVFDAMVIVREQINDSSMDSDDFDDSEFEGMVCDVLENHWNFKSYEKRVGIVCTENSQIYTKIKDLSGMTGGQNENEIVEDIVRNTLADQPLFDELEGYLIPETHEAELMEEIK